MKSECKSSRGVCSFDKFSKFLLLRNLLSQASIALLALVFVVADASAADVVTLEVETQFLDLDSGSVVEQSPEDVTTPAGADVELAYNADRTPHAVVFPVGEGVEMAYVANVPFDDVSSSDIASLSFSSESTDVPFSAIDCVVILTDQGALVKFGNAVESGSSVTFHYEQIQ